MLREVLVCRYRALMNNESWTLTTIYEYVGFRDSDLKTRRVKTDHPTKGDRKAPRALTALAHNLCLTFGEAPTKILTRIMHAL